MKKRNVTLLFLSILAGLIVPTISLADELTGTTTKVCSHQKEKCALITAQRTIPSKIGQIFALVSPELTLQTKGQPTQKISGDRGTIDFTNNQVVIAQISMDEIREVSIDLSTFEKKEFRTKK